MQSKGQSCENIFYKKRTDQHKYRKVNFEINQAKTYNFYCYTFSDSE